MEDHQMIPTVDEVPAMEHQAEVRHEHESPHCPNCGSSLPPPAPREFAALVDKGRFIVEAAKCALSGMTDHFLDCDNKDIAEQAVDYAESLYEALILRGHMR